MLKADDVDPSHAPPIVDHPNPKECGCGVHGFESNVNNIIDTPEAFRRVLHDTDVLASRNSILAGPRYLRLYQIVLTYDSIVEGLGWNAEDTSKPLWLLLNAAYVYIQQERYADANAVLGIAFTNHEEDCVGNAMFHLLLGTLKFRVLSPDHATDDLTRALLCGGPQMFDCEEDDLIKLHVETHVPPPAGMKSWDEVKEEGCLVQKMNSVYGHLAVVLQMKYGRPF
eukprot:PhF_6_TR40016/c0_g1_i1/m.59385